jgi:hypothetical protein
MLIKNFLSKSYKRIQGDESEHADAINVSLNFKSKSETNYAMSLDGSKDLKAGFDLSLNTDQTAKVSLSRKF